MSDDEKIFIYEVPIKEVSDEKMAEITLLKQKMAGSSVTEEEEQRALELEQELGLAFNIQECIDLSRRMSKAEEVLNEGDKLVQKIDEYLDKKGK